MIGLFVVMEEGGEFVPVSFGGLCATSAPIFGVRLGSCRVIYDSIMRRYGNWPFRTSRVFA